MTFKPRVVGGTERERLMVADLAAMASLSEAGAVVVLAALKRCKSNIERITLLNQAGVKMEIAREYLRKYDWLPS